MSGQLRDGSASGESPLSPTVPLLDPLLDPLLEFPLDPPELDVELLLGVGSGSSPTQATATAAAAETVAMTTNRDPRPTLIQGAYR